MLMVGDKIRRIKEIPGVPAIGDNITVSGIENGVISFETSLGAGVMSYDEYEKYFEKYDPAPQKHTPKREWGDKKWSYAYRCQYRTNGKVVQAYWGDVSAHASCLDTDKFDLDFGIRLAYNRAIRKYYKKCAKDMTTEINEMIAKRYSEVTKVSDICC